MYFRKGKPDGTISNTAFNKQIAPHHNSHGSINDYSDEEVLRTLGLYEYLEEPAPELKSNDVEDSPFAEYEKEVAEELMTSRALATKASKNKPPFNDKEYTLIYSPDVMIRFKNDRVVGIGLDCSKEDSGLGGASCGDSIDRVIERYGESKDITVSDDKLERTYNYPQYNLSFKLSKSIVRSLWVLDSKFFPKGWTEYYSSNSLEK